MVVLRGYGARADIFEVNRVDGMVSVVYVHDADEVGTLKALSVLREQVLMTIRGIREKWIIQIFGRMNEKWVFLCIY